MAAEEEGIRKSFRFRLFPTEEQENYFNQTFGCCRFVYNHFLNAKIEAYEAHKANPSVRVPNLFDCSKMLTDLKKTTFGDDGEPFLYGVDSTALVYELRHLDNAYKAFFRRVKNGEKPGFPRFKSRYDRQSFTTNGIKSSDKIKDGCICFPKIGRVKARIHRPIEGKIVSVTVSHDAADRWHASVNCKEVVCDPLPPKEDAVGITMGISQWIVTSEGEVFESAEAAKKSARKLAREQRKLARRQGPTKARPASNRYRKQRIVVAKVHAKIADQRSHAIHNATMALIRDHGTIVSREMASKSMVRSKKTKPWKLNRPIADASFYEINRQLAYKAQWYGRRFVLLPATAPTAQTCHDCGHVEKSVAAHLRPEWTCPECGSVHHRKYNGAKNVLDMGLAYAAEQTAAGSSGS